MKLKRKKFSSMKRFVFKLKSMKYMWQFETKNVLIILVISFRI